MVLLLLWADLSRSHVLPTFQALGLTGAPAVFLKSTSNCAEAPVSGPGEAGQSPRRSRRVDFSDRSSVVELKERSSVNSAANRSSR